MNAAPYNPRIELRPGMPEWDKLKKSIEDFGNVEPIVWNERTGNVVGGHQRLAVLKSMGYEEVPCSVVDLDERDEKLLNLALNKIRGEWDYDKLGELLEGFDSEVATASGFSEDEIEAILAKNKEPDREDSASGYVVTLVFENAWFAGRWAEAEGLSATVKEGRKDTVIRME